ncbi:sensor histidine kinase, partial [Roseovarius sp. D0-M9]|uniref:sensor histidine kinase n=1 Tax=Roseovarius sp. D0-M9 TaxID=3127117 RepID=UPI00300F7F50
MAEVSASDAPTEGTKYGSGSSTGAPDYPHGTRRDLFFADDKTPKISTDLAELNSAIQKAPPCHVFAQDTVRQKTVSVNSNETTSGGDFESPAPCFAAHMDVPIHLAGRVVGALRVIDTESRSWSTEDIRQLKSFAALVDDQIEFGELLRQSQRVAVELSDLQVEALQVSQEKTDCIDSVKHEVASPLTAIFGYTDLMLETSTTPEQDRYLKNVQTAAERLSGVIDHALDPPTTETDVIVMVKAPFCLITLLEAASSIVQLSAQDKAIDLCIEVDPNLPDTLLGDEPRLHQVLLNLLVNAIKFTSEGTVTMRVSRDAAGRDAVRFEVVDTGIGIDVENQKRIFERGAQATASTQGEFGGSGLGLSISQTLVGLMGGTLGVESDPGHGATFWFTVTLPIPSTPQNSAA